MRALTLGRARSDPATIAYLRQYFTTMSLAFRNDWVHHLARSRFSENFAEILARISRHAAAADGTDARIVAEDLRSNIAQWLGDFLRRNYGPYAQLRRYLRDRVPGLLDRVKTRRRISAPLDRHNVFQRLRKEGAGDDYLRPLAAELALVEDVVSGPAFAAFIRPYVPLLAPDAAREPAEESAEQLAPLGRGQNA
jgi:hypothetical protein